MRHHISVAEARESLAKHRGTFDDPASHAACFVNLLGHGTLQVELYQPIGIDVQQPHDQDELYVIANGRGDFEMAGRPTVSVTSGDVLFVPAGVEHRFVEFSIDFSTWVFLYGPKGGEEADSGR